MSAACPGGDLCRQAAVSDSATGLPSASTTSWLVGASG
jgi:hypothetical protein